MAGRAHKKLLAQQLAVAEAAPSEEEPSSSEEEEEAPTAAPFNPFSLLTVGDRRATCLKQQGSRCLQTGR